MDEENQICLTYLKGAVGSIRISCFFFSSIIWRSAFGHYHDPKLHGRFNSLACRPSITHSVLLQIVFELISAYLRFTVKARLVGKIVEKSNTLCTRPSSRAFARRPSCLLRSSSDFGSAVENEVVYSGALVPLLIRPPRPFDTPVLRWARPPTVHAAHMSFSICGR
jgi:hypothetical protein